MNINKNFSTSTIHPRINLEHSFNYSSHIPIISTFTGAARIVVFTKNLITDSALSIYNLAKLTFNSISKNQEKILEAKTSLKHHIVLFLHDLSNIGRGLIEIIPFIGNFICYKFDKTDHRFNYTQYDSTLDGLANGHGADLKYLSKELQNNEEIVLAAVRSGDEDTLSCPFQYASEELRNDQKTVLAVVTQWGCRVESYLKRLSIKEKLVLNLRPPLNDASKELQNNKDLVMAAVTKYGPFLKCVSKELQNDPEVVLAAVTAHGYALAYASETRKDDLGIVLAAIKSYPEAYLLASDNLRSNRIVIDKFKNARGN